MLEQLSLFDTLVTPERHARKPRFVDELGDYHRIRPYSHAHRYRYIQAQSPTKAFRIVIDIDRDVRGIARSHEWTSVLNAPAPNYTLLNPKNGHGHLFFELETPVALYEGANRKPVEFLAAVEKFLTELFGGDVGYAGYLCKNARNSAWELVQGRPEPYTLGELYEYKPHETEEQRKKRKNEKRTAAEFKSVQEKVNEASGFGRNCALFTQLRFWAYSALQDYSELGAWHEAARLQAESLNTFAVQLEQSEVRAIARSVAKWVWAKFGQDPKTRAAFIERQRFKQRKAAEKRRGATTTDIVLAIAKLKSQGKSASMRAVAKEIGCSAANLSKHYRDLF